MSYNEFTIWFFGIIIIGSFVGGFVIPKIYEFNR